MGLGIAMALAAVPTRVIAVRVTELRHVSEKKTRTLWRRTCELLREHDPEFPDVPYSLRHLEIRHDQFGEGYAAPTGGGAEAAALMNEYGGADLDVTYTAKTLACLIADARAGALADSSVVFWNTFAGKKKNPFGDSRPKRSLVARPMRGDRADARPPTQSPLLTPQHRGLTSAEGGLAVATP